MGTKKPCEAECLEERRTYLQLAFLINNDRIIEGVYDFEEFTPLKFFSAFRPQRFRKKISSADIGKILFFDLKSALAAIKSGRVVEIALYDFGNGLAQVIEGKANTYKWVSFTPCYYSQAYGPELYKDNFVILEDEIAEIGEIEVLPIKEIEKKRAESLKYMKSII